MNTSLNLCPLCFLLVQMGLSGHTDLYLLNEMDNDGLVER